MSLKKRYIFAKWCIDQKNMMIKKKKLKLGAITFEIFEYKIPGTFFVIFETVDIRFINQDNTEEDEQKFETRLNNLRMKHFYIFFIVLILILFFIIYAFIVYAINELLYVEPIASKNKNKFSQLFKCIFAEFLFIDNFFGQINKTLNNTFLEIFSFFLIDFYKLI